MPSDPWLYYLEVIDSATFDQDDPGMATRIDIRSLFRLDAAFEAALGLVLVVGGGVGWLTGSDFPVGRGLLIAAGAAFLGGSASVVLYFVRAPRRVLLELALGNGAIASAGLVWLMADRGFSTAGTSILVIAVAWKSAISALQLDSIRNRKAASNRTISEPVRRQGA
jgi:hypothetical protein